jgi:hypothetical protein
VLVSATADDKIVDVPNINAIAAIASERHFDTM